MVTTRSRPDKDAEPEQSGRAQRRRLETGGAQDSGHATAPKPKPLSELMPTQAPPLPSEASASSSKDAQDQDLILAGEGSRQSLRRRGAQAKPRRGPQLVASGKGAQAAAARSQAEKEAMAAFSAANAAAQASNRQAEGEDKENVGKDSRTPRRSMSNHSAPAAAASRNTFGELEQGLARPTLAFSASASALVSPTRTKAPVGSSVVAELDAVDGEEHATTGQPEVVTASEPFERGPPSSAPAIGSSGARTGAPGPAVLVPASISTKDPLSNEPTPNDGEGGRGPTDDAVGKRILAPSSSPLRPPPASAPSPIHRPARPSDMVKSTPAAILVQESPGPSAPPSSVGPVCEAAPPLSPQGSPSRILVPNSSPTPESRQADAGSRGDALARFAAESSGEESQESNSTAAPAEEAQVEPQLAAPTMESDDKFDRRLQESVGDAEASQRASQVGRGEIAATPDEAGRAPTMPEDGETEKPGEAAAERLSPPPGEDVEMERPAELDGKQAQVSPAATDAELRPTPSPAADQPHAGAQDAQHEQEELAQVEMLLAHTPTEPVVEAQPDVAPGAPDGQLAVDNVKSATPVIQPPAIDAQPEAPMQVDEVGETSNNEAPVFSSSQAELLQGLGSDDFEDISLSPDDAKRGHHQRQAQPSSRGPAQTHHDSPTLATRSFKRALSNRRGPSDVAQPANKLPRVAGPDSDDEFNDDSGFWEGVGGELDWAETSAIPSIDKGKGKEKAPMPAFAPPRPASVLRRPPQPSVTRRSSDVDDYESGPNTEKPPPTFGFQKANGSSFNISAAALKAAERRIASWNVGDDNGPGPSSRAPTPGPKPAVKKEPVAQPPSVPSPRVNAAAPAAPPPPVSRPAVETPTATEAFVPANVLSTPNTSQPMMRAAMTASVSSPSPAPQLLRTPKPMTPRPAASASPSVAAMAPRISLGMTPRTGLRGGRGGARPKFATPFKDPAMRAAVATSSAVTSSPWTRPRSEDLFKVPAACSQRPMLYPDDVEDSPAPPSRAVAAALQGAGPPKLNAPLKGRGQAVFDLELPAAGRKGMAEYGVQPEGLTAEEMGELVEEIPEILSRPSCAQDYAFLGPDDEDLGAPAALEALRRVGAVHVDFDWVRNHWGLVLWKLASLSASLPKEVEERWSWAEAMRQMRYRYEREINLAERSAIKRIQEHDSPASLSMVLCVFSLGREDGVKQEADDRKELSQLEDETGPVLVQLTDGWYRIRAEADVVLQRAISKGRIRRGSKLAICGAKLISGGSGTEVLQALDTSVLRICGNATKLARWDARLGFAPQPFVATMRSLTPDGGVVPLMDIVITRLYPVAYVDTSTASQRASGTSNARSEEHEARAAEAWERFCEKERAAVEFEFSNRIGSIKAVQRALGGVARFEEDEGQQADAETSEALLERLLRASDPSAFINNEIRAKGLSGLLPTLARMAEEQAKMEASPEEFAHQAEMEFKRRCPPREVRSFRICRFRDAQVPEGAADGEDGGMTLRKAHRSKRTVQLTIWDVKQLGSGFLTEGCRYTVTSLMPTSKGAWRKPDEAGDIFLSTRKESRWKRVQ